MLKPYFLPLFAKDRKRISKKHWPLDQLDDAIKTVVYSDEKAIPFEYNDHTLLANYKGYRLLHIGGRNSNWILLYKLNEEEVF